MMRSPTIIILVSVFKPCRLKVCFTTRPVGGGQENPTVEMQCTFDSKTEVRSLICDTTGRFVGVTFVDGSGELHALHTDSQLVKPVAVEEFTFVRCRSAPSR